MGLPPAPGPRHAAVATDFSRLAAGTVDWSAPSPVAGWTARDVVGHLVEWFPGFLAAGGEHRIPPGPSVADDPVGAWRDQAGAVQALLDDPASATTAFAHPRLPELPLDQAIDRFYTADVFMHTWDLAAATGQDIRLDPDFCAELLSGMVPMEQVLRESGQYGPRVEVSEDADVQARLLGFIGRDPAWAPPGEPD